MTKITETILLKAVEEKKKTITYAYAQIDSAKTLLNEKESFLMALKQELNDLEKDLFFIQES